MQEKSRIYLKENPTEFWDDDDFDRSLDEMAPATAKGAAVTVRVFKAWYESWEDQAKFNKKSVAEAKLLAKYGGLRFRDPDTKTDFMIDKEKLSWQRR